MTPDRSDLDDALTDARADLKACAAVLAVIIDADLYLPLRGASEIPTRSHRVDSPMLHDGKPSDVQTAVHDVAWHLGQAHARLGQLDAVPAVWLRPRLPLLRQVRLAADMADAALAIAQTEQHAGRLTPPEQAAASLACDEASAARDVTRRWEPATEKPAKRRTCVNCADPRIEPSRTHCEACRKYTIRNPGRPRPPELWPAIATVA